MGSFFFAALLTSTVTGAAITPRDSVASPFSLPQSSTNSSRAADLAIKRAGWLYGPSIAGNTSFYPAGSIGQPTAENQATTLLQFVAAVRENVTSDSLGAAAATVLAGGLTSIDSYTNLYDSGWPKSFSSGPYPGMLSNYSSDLLFSMERLSTNPYKIVRLSPSDTLPFAVKDAAKVSGQSLDDLHAKGQLFYVDHSNLKDLPQQDGKYSAACEAYFYINSKSKDFLPLAIKPNVDGSNWVVTPKDKFNDWLLAKMMFESNDMWYLQWFHLAATHEVVEIVYLAAIRTLSEEHPIMPVLHRILKLAFAFRPAASQVLLAKGAVIDQLYPFTGATGGDYTNDMFHNGASSFQGRYLMHDFQTRGLIKPAHGPALKNFPFYDDANVVYFAIRTFFSSFVDSYYTSDKALKADTELQAWIKEAGPAQIKDFPAAPLTIKDALVDMLTHIAQLVAINHNTLNTDTPVHSQATLPLHPVAFYKPLPTGPGTVADVVPYMPPLQAAIGQIVLLASFNRQMYDNTNETIAHMFDQPDMLARMNSKTKVAEATYRGSMQAFSKKVRARTFDKNGLSQGMPFIWKTLDPEGAPFWLAI